jgi:hypothetical protein
MFNPLHLFTPLGFLLALTPAHALPQAETSSPTPCNNSPLLCPKPYNTVVHLGAHNSAFVRDSTTGYSIAGNQFHNATASLSAGVRLLQAQVHLQSGTLQLCHTSCSLFDAGSLDSWLSAIKSWLDTNPTDVVTLLLVNSDDVPAETFGAVFDASGINHYGAPAGGTSDSWPTLAQMIADNTRLVTFVAGLVEPSPAYPYLLDEWQYVFETSYETVPSLAPFTCALDRPSTFASASDALAGGMLPLLNHFAYLELTDGVFVPDAGGVDGTNSPSEEAEDETALGVHARRCEDEWGGTKPVFVLVDFWDRGPAMETVDRLNGVAGHVAGRVAVDGGVLMSGTSHRFGAGGERVGWLGLVGFLVTVVLVL